DIERISGEVVAHAETIHTEARHETDVVRHERNILYLVVIDLECKLDLRLLVVCRCFAGTAVGQTRNFHRGGYFHAGGGWPADKRKLVDTHFHTEQTGCHDIGGIVERR